MLYAKAILWKNDEHSLDDAWWILNIMEDIGNNNFEWNYLMAKIIFEMGIYEEVNIYLNKAMEMDINDKKVNELLKEMQRIDKNK